MRDYLVQVDIVRVVELLIQSFFTLQMRFVDSILSNNSTDDHCLEFLKQNGLDSLFKMLKLPNLPLDFPISPACYQIAGVLKSILSLAHEKNVFIKGLENMKEIFLQLNPLFNSLRNFDGSILLEDLTQHLSAKKGSASFNFVTPLLQAMSAAHAYIVMFVHICRTGHGEIRAISIEQWGSRLGLEVIQQLSDLYISLVWESTLLLGLNDSNSQNNESVRAQLDRLTVLLSNLSTGGSSPMSSQHDNENAASPMDIDFDSSDPVSICNRQEHEKPNEVVESKSTQQKYIKPLLTVASRLGRTLAELFGLLVKLSVGTPIRRRTHSTPLQSSAVTLESRNISKQLNILLCKGLGWQTPFDTNIPKYR